MTNQDALNYIREHLTNLYANDEVYLNGLRNVIDALEDVVVPMLEKRIDEEVIKCDRLKPSIWRSKNVPTLEVEHYYWLNDEEFVGLHKGTTEVICHVRFWEKIEG